MSSTLVREGDRWTTLGPADKIRPFFHDTTRRREAPDDGDGPGKTRRVMLVDENAFGVLVSYFAVEDEEYGMERDAFVARFEAFRAAARLYVREHRLGADARALDLGHALYVEIGDGDHSESPLTWAKRARAALQEAGYETVVAVTHGGRWVDDAAESFFSTEHLGDASLVTLSNPSEPLRRALHADAASRPADEDPQAGWGPGLYLDTEAAEALGMAPKNAPTVLRIGAAGFYRAGR